MSKKILIAEDDIDNREMLRNLLARFELYGVQVLVASDGCQAYNLAVEEHPDLILLDIMMPEMDGCEVCTKLKADPALADMYVIMLTAKTSRSDRMQAVLAGADEYLTKPFDTALVLDRVRQVLNVMPL